MSLNDLGSKFGKYLILCMKIRAFLAKTFWIVKTYVELKLEFVCEGIIPSRYLKLKNSAMTARISDFCLLKTESMCDFSTALL